MEDEFDDIFDDGFDFEPENPELIERFEKMLSDGNTCFFEEDEFEELLDYYSWHNHLDNSLKIIELAKNQYPFSYEFELREAEILSYNDQMDKAIRILDKLEVLQHNNQEIYLTKARIFSEYSQHHKAIENYEKAIHYFAGDNDELGEIYFQLGMEYSFVNDYENAKQQLMKASSLEIDNIDTLYELSYLFDVNNDSKNAVAFFTNVIDEKPFNYDAWLMLASHLQNIGENEKALVAIDYAIAIDDKLNLAYISKGNLLESLERYPEAIENYIEFVNVCGRFDTNAYVMLADLYLYLGHFNEALDNYTENLKLENDNDKALLGCAECYIGLHEPKKALPYLKKTIYLDYSNLKAKHLLALTYDSIGEFDKAEENFLEVVKYDKTNWQAHIDFSEFLYKNSFYEEALETITNSLNQFPDQSELLYRLAGFLFDLGMDSDAMEILFGALVKGSENYELIFAYYPEIKNTPTAMELIHSFINNKNEL